MIEKKISTMLSHEPMACLKHMSAGVSKSPAELLRVWPVLEFNMVDPRFVAESDALSEPDQRPNLTDLSFAERTACMFSGPNRCLG